MQMVDHMQECMISKHKTKDKNLFEIEEMSYHNTTKENQHSDN